MAVNPFDALGLPARPDLSDEQVRAAWRAIAAATHPDRRDGGDVARYTAATAAYAVLRTPWGRSEAFAETAWRRRAYPRRSANTGPTASRAEATASIGAVPSGALATVRTRSSCRAPAPQNRTFSARSFRNTSTT